LGREFSGYEASGIAEQVLWPVRLHAHDCNLKKRFSPPSPVHADQASIHSERPK
jgi:hypothetical protein